MEENKKSWFGRNWVWAVPLGGCLTLIIVIVAFFGAVIFGVSEMFSGSEPYQVAVEQASKNELVIEVLGEPIETDGIMNGKIDFENDEGTADFSIPLAGPKGKARVYIEGTKSEGEWTYQRLYVITKESEEQIDLLDNYLNQLE